ncbi:MAG: TadE family type IV pilus minor pilin [Dermatophilaceae bacterium]
MTPARRERGMATAELAVAIPSVVVVLAVCLAAVDLGIRQVQCVDAAGTAARQLARGDSEPAARQQAGSRVPDGSRVTVVRGDGQVTVLVEAPVPAVLALLGSGARAHARATARLELP